MKKVIYCFSGTGNSLRAAQRIASALGDTEIISMRCLPSETPAEDADVIGFVFPVYHWTVPDMVVRFIQGLQINPDAYIFGISTLIWINCHSFEVLSGLLREKGATLSYARMLPSVGSSLTIYKPMPDPERQVLKSEKLLTEISAEIAAQKRRKYPKANFLTRMIYPTRVKYTAMLPVTDKGYVISESCTGCGVCAAVCPRRNIAIQDGKPVFRHQCTFCMACIAYCPAKAVNYKVTPELKANYPFFRFHLSEEQDRYHNPYISHTDIASDRHYVE